MWRVVESVVANVYGMSATGDDLKKMKMNRSRGKASINRGEARLQRRELHLNDRYQCTNTLSQATTL